MTHSLFRFFLIVSHPFQVFEEKKEMFGPEMGDFEFISDSVFFFVT